MGHADYLKNGTWNAICDRCGSKFKFSMLKKEWDGLYVCTAKDCWEPRQPQDYLRGIRDNMSVPISRPGGGNLFLDTIYVKIVNIFSYLTFTINRLKLLETTVSSTGFTTSDVYRPPKTINAPTINSITLG